MVSLILPSLFVIFIVNDLSQGVGGDTGWGIIGEKVEKTIEAVAGLIDTNLAKLAQVLAKEQKVISANNANSDNTTVASAQSGDIKQTVPKITIPVKR